MESTKRPPKIPHEILCKILLHLPYHEIVSLRVVNKTFRNVIDHLLRIETLVIYHSVIPVNYREFSTNRPFDCHHSLRTANLERIESHLKTPMFSAIRQLKINDELLHRYPNTCELLNHFKNLVSLEIAAVRLQQAGTLTLPNLRVLTLHFSCFDGNTNKLRLDTPKLERLRFEHFNGQMNLELLYPETIRYCRVNEFHSIIKSMTGLEYLFVDRWKEELDNRLLHSLPKIKEIHLGRCGQVFTGLKDQVKLYDRDVAVYLLGIRFYAVTPELLDTFSFESSQRTIELWRANFDRLAPAIAGVYYLEYQYLEENFKRVPSDLVGRLVDLQSVFVGPIANMNEFLAFFKQCKSLTLLEIKNSSLDQNFYSNLPNACPTLQYLTIKIKENQKLLYSLNFDFLFDLKYLLTFTTNKQLSWNFARRMVGDLKHATVFRYGYLSNKVHLNLYYANKYELVVKKKKRQVEKSFTTLDDLFKFLKHCKV